MGALPGARQRPWGRGQDRGGAPRCRESAAVGTARGRGGTAKGRGGTAKGRGGMAKDVRALPEAVGCGEDRGGVATCRGGAARAVQA